MKILDVMWFTNSQGCFGIVATENEVKEIKFYLGMGLGHDEGADAEYIAEHGAPVYAETLIDFFKKWQKDDNDTTH